MFKRLSSVHMPEKRQKYIYYTCVNYDVLPAAAKEAIRAACRDTVAAHGRTQREAYEKALMEYLTTGESVLAISQRNFIRPETLRVMRNAFYTRFNREIIVNQLSPLVRYKAAH